MASAVPKWLKPTTGTIAVDVFGLLGSRFAVMGVAGDAAAIAASADAAAVATRGATYGTSTTT